MVEVRLRGDETIDEALKRFKKECDKSGVLSEIKKREHYEKPSDRRKKKIASARRKARKKNARASY
ncbi:MAG: 30S ribosomal protein S21 [bacterium]